MTLNKCYWSRVCCNYVWINIEWHRWINICSSDASVRAQSSRFNRWSKVKIFEYLPCSFKARQRFLFVWMKWWIIFLQHWMHYVKNKFYIFLGFSKHMLLPATHDYFQSFPIVKGATCECFCWEIFVCIQDSVGKHLTFSFSYCKSDFFFRSCSLQPNRSVRKDCVGCI